MPVCEVCDGETFYDLDGKYYCVSCSTQSQEIQVEARQEMGYGKDYYCQLQQKTGNKIGKKNMPHNVGRTWVIYEGYQYLLKAQVEALIKMGFDQQLKNVVGDLWFFYLREMKVAFYDGEPLTMELKKKNHEGGRNFKKIGVIPPYIKRRKSQKCPKSVEKRRKLQENNLSQESPQQQEEQEIISHQPNFDLKKIEKFFSQQHTLILCYLGLLVLKEPILITDLLRWSNEGALPYHKASVVLPEEMKFAYRDDTKLCRKKTPSPNKMSTLAKKMIEKLKLNISFSIDELQLLLTSVIVDLEFDYAVLKIVCFLVKYLEFGFSYHVSSWNVKFLLEGYLAAFVFYAVKLLYFLDGESEVNGKINVKVLRDFKLPLNVESWKDWVLKHMNKVKKKLHNGIPQSLNDLQYINDVSTYVDYCCKDVFNSFQSRDCVQATHEQMSRVVRRVTSSNETKESLFKALNTSARLLNEKIDFDKIVRLPSSFPLSHSHTGEPLYSNVNNLDEEMNYNNEVCILSSNSDISGKSPFISCLTIDPNDSCKYLIDVLSKRFLMEQVELHPYVKAVGSAIRVSKLNLFQY